MGFLQREKHSWNQMHLLHLGWGKITLWGDKEVNFNIVYNVTGDCDVIGIVCTRLGLAASLRWSFLKNACFARRTVWEDVRTVRELHVLEKTARRIFDQGILLFADQPNARRGPKTINKYVRIDFKVVKILNIKFNNQINKWRILINILLSNLSP